MSLRSEAEAEAEKRFPTPPRCSDTERGIAYLQRTEFVAGAEWLAARPVTDAQVEAAARAWVESGGGYWSKIAAATRQRAYRRFRVALEAALGGEA